MLLALTKSHGGGPKRTLLARFDVGYFGPVSFGGVAEVGEALLATPLAGFGSYGLVVAHPSGGILVSVGDDAFHAPPPGQAPRLEP